MNDLEQVSYKGCVHVGLEKLESLPVKDYFVEEKHDGQWGELVFDDEGKVHTFSRNGKPKNLKGVAEELEKTGLKNTRIICELGFGSQAETIRANKVGHHRVILFDVIKLNGFDLRKRTLKQRRATLVYLYEKDISCNIDMSYAPLSEIHYDLSLEEIKTLYEGIVKDGGEGIVLKDPSKPYIKGKLPDWLKIKKEISKEFQIIGYENSTAKKYVSKDWIKAILLAEVGDQNRARVMQCGSMTEEMREAFSEDKSFYLGKIVEIAGFEIFTSGAVRHPSIKRMRPDLDK